MKKLLDEKNEKALLIGLFVAALALRLWFSLWYHRPADFIQSDMWVYNHRAGHLIDRQGNAFDTFSPIGYPAMLALIYKIVGGRNYGAVGVVQDFMGAAIVTLSHLVARRITGTYWVAAATGIIVALYPPMVFYCGLCLTETPFCFFLLLSTWALFKAIDTSGLSVDHERATPATKPWVTWAWMALCGVSLSLGNALRSNLVMFFPMLPLFVWVMLGRDLKKTAIFSAKIFAFTLPIMIAVSVHMSALRGKFVPFSTNGGLNFFLAHAEYVGVRWKDSTGFAHTIVPIPNMIRYKDFYESPVPLYEESHYYAQAFAILKDNPYRLAIALDNIVEGLGLGRQELWPGWRGHDVFLGAVAHVFAWLIWPVVFAYFVVLARLKRLLLPEEAPRLLVYLHVAALIVTVYTFLGDPRMRVPFDPLLIVLFLDAIHRSNQVIAQVRADRAELAERRRAELGEAGEVNTTDKTVTQTETTETPELSASPG
ncbi:MAG: phospholipid carrier-dependent glycosyltransferase [Polyangiaceae bacterium]